MTSDGTRQARPAGGPVVIRKSEAADFAGMLAIINDAAQAYRGVIPADRWHEPYMPPDELAREIERGVVFWVAEHDKRLSGVMGIQDKGDVALVRHAYVAPTTQRGGVGTSLLRHVEGLVEKPILIGTWAAASWAVAFYQRNGFTTVPSADKDRLLSKYWSIPPRQIETSVVLANARWKMDIRADDLTGPEVIQLLRDHLEDMKLHSPPESIHALDLVGLRKPEITFWSAWQGSELMGCGAIKELDSRHGEIKSMRTARSHRRKGVAAALLRHILAEARTRSYERLSLETGSAAAFVPARNLYARFGFKPCGPFAQYVEDPYSVFMTREV